MIHVIATIELHAGQRADFLAEFRRLVPLVQAEDGCLAYGAAVDLPTTLPSQGPVRDDVVTVVEQWADIAALEAHLMASHMIDYRAKVKDKVVRTTLAILEPA